MNALKIRSSIGDSDVPKHEVSEFESGNESSSTPEHELKIRITIGDSDVPEHDISTS